MARRPREVRVASREHLTPNIVALTLSGEDLHDFPEGFEGGYIKLSLPQPDGSNRNRSFSIRRFDATARELEIHMASHGDSGPAGAWLSRVELDDTVTIQGPGSCRRLTPEADWFLLAGDLTALAAIRVNLEQLPEGAVGHAFVEVPGPDDELEISRPSGIGITWIHNADPTRNAGGLVEAVRGFPWLPGRPSVWVAGEYTAARALREYFRDERDVDLSDLYASCYWKIGVGDEGMKAAKKADSGVW
ncbi:MAG: siderophore-interacting protein [Acidobacteriota bacterium]